MQILKTEENGALILSLEGRLDTVTSPDFQEVLIPAIDEAKDVKLNFEKLDYVSSAGLRILLMGQKAASEKGCSFILTSVSSEIMEVLEMTGFTDLLTIE